MPRRMQKKKDLALCRSAGDLTRCGQEEEDEIVRMTLDEYEAVRLIDLEDFSPGQ